MRFLIIQPIIDITEILGSFFYFIKNNDHMVYILYQLKYHDSITYFCKLFYLQNKIRFIHFKSHSSHFKDFTKVHKILFFDELQLNNFLEKDCFKKFQNKIYLFNIQKPTITLNLKYIFIENRLFNEYTGQQKYLINNYFDPNLSIKTNLNKTLKFILIGNLEFLNLNFLKYLLQFDIQIFFILTNNTFIENIYQIINFNTPKLKIIQKVKTIDLINNLQCIDYVFTLNKNNIIFDYKTFFIIPFIISLGKPIITDSNFYSFYHKYIVTNNNFIYENNFTSLKKTFNYIFNIDNSIYEKTINKIIKFRNIKINEQFLNFHLLF